MVADCGLKAPKRKVIVCNITQPQLTVDIYGDSAIQAMQESMMLKKALPPEFGEAWGVSGPLYIESLLINYISYMQRAYATLSIGKPCTIGQIG